MLSAEPELTESSQRNRPEMFSTGWLSGLNKSESRNGSRSPQTASSSEAYQWKLEAAIRIRFLRPSRSSPCSLQVALSSKFRKPPDRINLNSVHIPFGYSNLSPDVDAASQDASFKMIHFRFRMRLSRVAFSNSQHLKRLGSILRLQIGSVLSPPNSRERERESSFRPLLCCFDAVDALQDGHFLATTKIVRSLLEPFVL